MADSKNNKISIILDEESLEILGAVSPELRNSAIIVALKMFKNSSIYKKYFCVSEECKESDSEENIEEETSLAIEDKLKKPKSSSISSESVPASTEEPIITFDSF